MKISQMLAPTEHRECQTLIEWARWAKWEGNRVSDLLVMIPNGAFLGGVTDGQRASVMAKLKAEGFRNGVSDYLLTVPIHRLEYGGLWLEMKRTKGSVVSLEQIQFQAIQIRMGYRSAICKGALQAIEQIKNYLYMASGTTPGPIGSGLKTGVIP